MDSKQLPALVTEPEPASDSDLIESVLACEASAHAYLANRKDAGTWRMAVAYVTHSGVARDWARSRYPGLHGLSQDQPGDWNRYWRFYAIKVENGCVYRRRYWAYPGGTWRQSEGTVSHPVPENIG